MWSLTLSPRANYKLENHATARLGRMAMGMAHAAHVRLYVCQVRGGHDVCPESGTQWPIPIRQGSTRGTPSPSEAVSCAGSGRRLEEIRPRRRLQGPGCLLLGPERDHVRYSTTYGIRPRTVFDHVRPNRPRPGTFSRCARTEEWASPAGRASAGMPSLSPESYPKAPCG